MKILIELSVSKQWRPLLDIADLGLYCLSMSHKKDSRLIWVNYLFFATCSGEMVSSDNLCTNSLETESDLNSNRLTL